MNINRFEMNKIISLAKYLKHNYLDAHRNYLIQKNAVKVIMKSIESVKGKTDPKLFKLSNEYARDILGWIGYAPWLYVYSAVAESFKEGWIPDNYYGKVVIPAIKGKYSQLYGLKSITNKLFDGKFFPDCAYLVNGLWYSNKHEVIPESKVKEIIFKNSEVVVFKTEYSKQGKGVYFLKKSDFDTKKIQSLGNGVVQNLIEQHQFFEEFMPASVATIRITTVFEDNGKTSVRGCGLRLGRIEDTHIKSASHIKIPINLKSGELNYQGYLPNWTTTDRHPDTNIVFAKRKIPCFDKCLSAALELHQLMPYDRCIGWDMIIDKYNNVRVMEWNGWQNDIKFSEATQGPCFSDLGWERLWHKEKIQSAHTIKH